MKNSNQQTEGVIDKPVLIISGGILLLFVILALINQDMVSDGVDYLFNLSATYFGPIYQVLLLGTFIIALVLGFSKFGKIRLGNVDHPEMSTFRWISIIMCTLLAAGGVFWAAAEPLSHFLTAPPHFDVESGTQEAVAPALATSFVDWGFLAWVSLGTLGTFVLMYAHYHRGQPLKPRALLYPIMGEKIMRKKSVFGAIVDIFSIISVAAGTIGPVGFLGLQAGYALMDLFGIPNNLTIQIAIIATLVVGAGVSAATGIHKGIQLMSRYNVILSIILVAAIVVLGPTMFIFDSFLESFGVYVQDFVEMTTQRSDLAWLGGWMVFFFAWFIGYGPMMAMFVSRISRGRTVRELVTAVAVIAPVITAFWFTIIGGTGISEELKNPGSVSGPFNDGGQPAAMMAIAQNLPLGTIIGFLLLVATVVFVLTTTDSMSLTISMAITGDGYPSRWLRVFWAFLIGLVSVVLVSLGESSIDALQSFIVVTAVPVSLLLLTTFWTAPHVVKKLYKEQGFE